MNYKNYKISFNPFVFLKTLFNWPVMVIGYLLYKTVPPYRKLSPIFQRLIAILLVFTTLISSLYSLSILFVPKASAAWYDDSYSYRQRIDATSTNGSAQSNVFISFTLDTATLITAGKMQSSCQDVRITDTSGKLLKYHIGRTNACNLSNTTIDFLVSSFIDGNSTYYVYYGNPSAASLDAGAFTQSQASNYSIGTLGSTEKATGPVGYWKFDDGTGTSAKDATTNANNGTISGATWQNEDQCISGKCLYFDGSNDNVTVANTSNRIIPNGAFSLSLWFKLTESTTGAGQIYSLINNDTFNTSGFRFGVDNTSGGYGCGNGGVPKVLFWATESGGTGSLCSSTSITQGQWYNVVVVYTGSTGTMYLNGTSVATSSSMSIVSNTNTIQIGTAIGGKRYFNGPMDEIKIYNQALTAAQVQANYAAKAAESATVLGANTQNNNALSNGLVGYWKMDESSWTQNCSTATATDSSGNSNNGISCPSTTGPTTASGKYGNAGSFDGSDDYVSVTNTTSINLSGNFTISAWVNPTSVGSLNEVISKEGTSAGYYMWIDSNRKIRVGFNTGASEATSTNAISLSTWSHIVGTWDGTNLRIYINGALDKTTAGSSNPAATTNALSIGAYRDGTSRFTGKIDEARVYNRALSPDESSQLYTFAPGPTSYWKLDEKAGTTINDSSGNGNGGTLTTGASGNQTTSTQAWKSGKYGAALNFDGSDDYVDIAKTWTVTNDNITVSAWIYDTGDRTSDIIFDGSAGRVAMEVASSNLGCLTNNDAWKTGGTIPANQWTYVSCVFDGTNMNGYINGVLAFSTADNAPSADITAMTISGNTNHAFEFPGLIDDVKLYSYARTSGQIVEDMNGGHPLGGSPVGSPVGYWKFNEGADNTCSGGTNDACNSGSAGSALDGAQTNMSVPATSTSGWTQAGKFGKALNFDGTDDYIQVSNTTALHPSSAITVTGWVRRSTIGTVDVIAATSTILGNDWWLDISSDKARFGIKVGSTLYFPSGTTTIAANTWYHIAGVYDGETASVYVNGILDGSDTTPSGAMTTTSQNMRIGAYSDSVSLNSPFGGQLDEVKLYNTALTADQIKIDMNQGASQVLGAISDNSSYQKQAANQEYCVPGDSTSCAAPVAKLDMEEGTGTTLNDSSGSGNNGSLTIGATGTQTTSSQAWKPGKVGKSLNFDGTDDTGSITDAANINFSGDFTVEAWVKSTLIDGAYHVIMDKGWSGSSYPNIQLEQSTSNQFRLTFEVDSTHSSNAVGTTTVVSGTWYHVVGTRTSGVAKIYVNGVLEGTGGSAVGDLTSTGKNWTIGARRSGSDSVFQHYFKGGIDQIRIFNYARTASQVALDYNRGGPVGWWKFDECQGTTANDSSGNGNSGTITPGAGTYTSAGTCAVSSASSMWYNGASGKRNYSLAFDGSDDYVNTNLTFNSTSITGGDSFAAWIKTSTAAGSIVGNSTSTSFSEYNCGGITVDTGGKAQIVAYNGSAYKRATSTTSVNNNAWHYVVGVHNPTNNFLYIYVDGRLEASTDMTTSISCTGTSLGAQIGKRHKDVTPDYFNGQIDDVRIYNYPLTATQVKNLYSGGAVNYSPASGTP